MVDAVVLNYNDAATTKDCIKNFEKCSNVRYILVIDNASSDNSYSDLCKLKTERIIILRSPRNGGYGYGNNLGIRYLISQCDSEYILLANPDVLIDEVAVAKLEESLKKHPDYGIIAPFMCDATGERQWNTAFMIPSRTEYIMSLGVVYSKLFHPWRYDDIFDWEEGLHPVGAVSGSCFMMNAKLFYQYGMFDEAVFLYCEETILGLKLSKAGIKIGLLPDCFFVHKHSVSINKTFMTEMKKKRLLVNSKTYVIEHYYDVRGIVLCFVKLLGLVSVIEAGVLSLRKRIIG